MVNKYEILGVGRNATTLEITRAYRRAAVKYHPDKNPKNVAEATEKFRAVSEAFVTLSNDQKREQYNLELQNESKSKPRNQYGWNGTEEDTCDDVAPEYTEEDEDDTIIDEKSVADLSNFISQTLYKFVPDMYNTLSHNEKMEVTLEECFTGTTKKLHLREHKKRCDKCIGTGTQANSIGSVKQFVLDVITQQPRFVKCLHCKGKGVLTNAIDINIHIPAGCKTGDKVVLKGFGSANQSLLGMNGDLVVTFFQSQIHPLFHRHPDPSLPYDLILQHEISLREALVGFQHTFVHLDGKLVDFVSKDKHVSYEGEYVVVKGQGMPLLNQGGRGDLHVRLHIVMPKYSQIMYSIGALDVALP